MMLRHRSRSGPVPDQLTAFSPAARVNAVESRSPAAAAPEAPPEHDSEVDLILAGISFPYPKVL